jgi:hypothetical protein
MLHETTSPQVHVAHTGNSRMSELISITQGAVGKRMQKTALHPRLPSSNLRSLPGGRFRIPQVRRQAESPTGQQQDSADHGFSEDGQQGSTVYDFQSRPQTYGVSLTGRPLQPCNPDGDGIICGAGDQEMVCVQFDEAMNQQTLSQQLMEQGQKLTAADLRTELKRRGLPTTGKKQELLDRLEDSPMLSHGPQCVDAWAFAEYVVTDPSRMHGLELFCDKTSSELRDFYLAEKDKIPPNFKIANWYQANAALNKVDELCAVAQ